MSKMTDEDVIKYIQACKAEAKQAKMTRMQQNKINWDAYHNRQDWSHKQKGQSQEFLPKVSNAVEQNANMVQQGLLDLGNWFQVNPQDGISEDSMEIKPSVIYRLLDRQLSKDGFIKKVGDMLKSGMLGSLIILKVGGKSVNKPKFTVRRELKNGKMYNKLFKSEDKAWALNIQLVRQEDYYPDPTNRWLYEIEDSESDLHEIQASSEGEDAIYSKEKVTELSAGIDSTSSEQNMNKSRETDQNIADNAFRKKIRVTEFWGNILNSDGELCYENVVCTLANDRVLIRPPEPNPFWHQESPYVTSPLLSVPGSVWHKAMVDSAVMINLAANELYNLLLDSGIMSVFGIKQIRKDWLEDASEVSDGVQQGATLSVNSSCPPGMKVIESVYTGGNPNEAMQMLSLLGQEGAATMFTNEIRSGGADMKNTRATAIVENSNALNNMSTGLIKNLEGDENSGLMTKLLTKSWKVIAQNMNDLDSKEVEALLGKQQAQKLLAMGKEQIFADTVQSSQFRVFGISAVMNKMKDFTKLTTMLQTVFSNPMLTEAFLKKYSIPKFLEEIMCSLDIKTFKFEADVSEGGELIQPTAQPQPPAGPDLASQVPQAGAAVNQTDMNAAAGSQPASPAAL